MSVANVKATHISRRRCLDNFNIASKVHMVPGIYFDARALRHRSNRHRHSTSPPRAKDALAREIESSLRTMLKLSTLWSRGEAPRACNNGGRRQG